MPNVRIHLLAKELSIPSKVLVERCRDEGLTVKSHMSSMPEEMAEKFRREFGAKPAARKEPEAKAAVQAAAAPPPPVAPPAKAAAPAALKPKEALKPKVAPPTPEEEAPKRRKIKTFQMQREDEEPVALVRGHAVPLPEVGRPAQRQRIRQPFRPKSRDQFRPKFRPEPTGPAKGHRYVVEPPITVRTGRTSASA
jgi:hypothetical protein